ncbi:uncharacterized protein [Coffea arabica]|uniref:Thioredoxin-like fold domain-containing protein n=1 Tax=Coffea arabica TaxID=13443 RepID=A0A6P6UHP8_COFAR|nr:uncharacterized protein LOC113711047 [Coffea arabica]XP_027092892.1 uncharacterized protein LOC113713372 [Coffea arabica]
MQLQNHLIFKPPFLLFCFLIYIGCAKAQVSIPPKPDGFWYHNRAPNPDSVVIEAFFDPLCPDSRDSWKPLKEAIQNYGSSIALVVHTFPLPYHDNAFLASRALHIVDKLNVSVTYHLLEAFFGQQEKFYGRATSNLTRAFVQEEIARFVVDTVGRSYSPAIFGGFRDVNSDQATRISFKYGGLRGVYGTPTFFVNGFPLPDAGSALDNNGWLRILDPLVNKQGSHRG